MARANQLIFWGRNQSEASGLCRPVLLAVQGQPGLPAASSFQHTYRPTSAKHIQTPSTTIDTMNLSTISKLFLSVLCFGKFAIATQIDPTAQTVHDLIMNGNDDLATDMIFQGELSPEILSVLKLTPKHIAFYGKVFPLPTTIWQEFVTTSNLAMTIRAMNNQIINQQWDRIVSGGNKYNMVNFAQLKNVLNQLIQKMLTPRAQANVPEVQQPTTTVTSPRVEQPATVVAQPVTVVAQPVTVVAQPVQHTVSSPITTNPVVVNRATPIETPLPRGNSVLSSIWHQQPEQPNPSPRLTETPRRNINSIFHQAEQTLQTSPNVPLPRGASRGGARNIMPTGPLITTGPVPECWAPNGYDVDPAKCNPFRLIGAVADDNPLEFSQKRNEARAFYEVPLAHAATHEQAKIYVKAIDDAFELLIDPLRKQQWLREHPFTA